jgi:beta-D-xylosidase 4
MDTSRERVLGLLRLLNWLVLINEEIRIRALCSSDCGAVGTNNYKLAGWTSPTDIISKSLAAGLDSDCGNGHDTWAQSMNASLASGNVPMSLADTAITRLFKVQFRLGIFDKPEVQPSWAKYGAETINTPVNRDTVLAAAAQGLVLLVNKAKTLPLRKSAVKTVALVGPNVQNIVTKDCGVRKEPSYLGCEGCYCANAIDPVSPRDGFASHATIDYVAGCSTIMCDPSEKSKPGGWNAAAAAAGKADATVVIVGLDVTQECEGHDRMNVTAPGGQNEFVAQVCNSAAASKKACIVLVMAGSAVDLSRIEALPSVGAIMWVGYPGERGGEAIANAVFGVSDEFGKLSYSIYRQSYYDKLSPLDFSMRPNGTDNPGRT